MCVLVFTIGVPIFRTALLCLAAIPVQKLAISGALAVAVSEVAVAAAGAVYGIPLTFFEKDPCNYMLCPVCEVHLGPHTCGMLFAFVCLLQIG